MLLEYVLVFVGAAIPWFEIAIVIPAGIIAGLSPLWVVVLAFIGNVLTVIPVIIGYEKMKAWMDTRKRKKNKPSSSKRENRGKKIWGKYGLPGLALLGPILTGIHIAALMAMLLGAKKSLAIIWTTVSLALWAVVFGGTTALGLDIFVK